jgi:hypothetical protein
MRRPAAVVAAALALVLAAGCGVSATRRPADLGDAAVAAPFGSGVVKQPPSPDGAARPVDLVTRYLQAAVGEYEQALESVRRYFTPDATWKESPGLTVVRVIGDPSETRRNRVGNSYLVRVPMQPVGTLGGDGSVDVSDDVTPFTATFEVVGQETPNQWRLKSAPTGLMLSDTALESLYQPSPVYFWNLERTNLVPDLRYVPLTMGEKERLDKVVDWQLAGPTTWLAPAVAHRPNVQRKDRVAPIGDRVVVNLSSGAASDDPDELQRLADQLRWTLRIYTTLPLELKIEDRVQKVDGSSDAYLARNAAALDRVPVLFSVDGEDRKVVAKRGGPVRILDVEGNRQVSYAAVSAAPYDVAAFVGGGGRRLTIARTGTSEQDTGKITQAPVRGLRGSIGRPVWIPGRNSEQFLVPAGGGLYVVDTKRNASAITLRGIGAVSTVSVSPDGRRVALAAGGRAFVAALAVDKGTVLRIGPELRELVPGRMTVNAVAWVSEDKVLVAGADADERAALFRTTADGAIASDESPAEAAFVDVIAYPSRTGGDSSAGEIVASTAGAVFYVFSRSVEAAPDLNFPFYAG